MSGAMSDDLTREQTYDVPAGYQPLPWHRGFGRQVGPLFEKLKAAPDFETAHEIEFLIWHLWSQANTAGGGLLLRQGVQYMNEGDHEKAANAKINQEGGNASIRAGHAVLERNVLGRHDVDRGTQRLLRDISGKSRPGLWPIQ